MLNLVKKYEHFNTTHSCLFIHRWRNIFQEGTQTRNKNISDYCGFFLIYNKSSCCTCIADTCQVIDLDTTNPIVLLGIPKITITPISIIIQLCRCCFELVWVHFSLLFFELELCCYCYFNVALGVFLLRWLLLQILPLFVQRYYVYFCIFLFFDFSQAYDYL